MHHEWLGSPEKKRRALWITGGGFVLVLAWALFLPDFRLDDGAYAVANVFIAPLFFFGQKAAYEAHVRAGKPVASIWIPALILVVSLAVLFFLAIVGVLLVSPEPRFAGMRAYYLGDYEFAAEQYKIAAIGGDPRSQESLGIMYRDGVGVEQNFLKARMWLRHAADNGGVGAQHALGAMYAKGAGIPQDYRRALYWFEKSCVNCTAWLLATCPDDDLRDGERAVSLAEQELARSRTANRLGTLAAAYAEVGRFQEAVETQREAMEELPRSGPVLDDYSRRLRSYEEGIPWRTDWRGD